MGNLKFGIISLWLLLALLVSCSHDYEANTLDLGKYQWNMWPDMEAGAIPNAGPDAGSLTAHEPSCGWDVLHRGNGKLVRIPATLDSHFTADEQSTVTWFHVRHTLPELWAERDITLSIEGVSHQAEVYLNGELVGSHLGENSPFTIDITSKVYYVRDNHLAIRVYDPDPATCGITGKIVVISKPLDQTPGLDDL